MAKQAGLMADLKRPDDSANPFEHRSRSDAKNEVISWKITLHPGGSIKVNYIISYHIISYHIISYHHCTIISGSISMFLCSITIFLGFYSLCSYINHYKSSFSMFCLVVFHVKSPLFYDERSRRSPFQFLDLLPFSSFTSRAEAAPAPRWAGGQALFCDAPSSPGGPVGRMFGRWNGTLKPWEWEFRWNLYDFVD